jgi:hypothetical protein
MVGRAAKREAVAHLRTMFQMSERRAGSDPAYCDAILRRFEGLTGKEAKLATTGEGFEDVEKVRGKAALFSGERT